MEKFKVSFEANNQQLKSIGTKHASDTYADIEATFILGDRWTDMDSVSAVWWNDFTRVATVLDSQGKCIVPHEVLTRKGCVRVNLVGSIVEGDELITRLTSYSAEAVQVNEKIKLTGSETSEITPSQFEQFVTEVKADADRAETVRDEAEAARDVAVSAKDTAVNAVEGFEDIVDTATATAVQTIQGEGATQVTAIQTEGTTQVASVRTEGSTQVTAVQDKGDEVLGSIPADYTQLSQNVTDLKSEINEFTHVFFGKTQSIGGYHYPYNFIAGHTYTIKNLTSGANMSARTRNEVGGVNIDTASDGFYGVNARCFTASANASYFYTYTSSPLEFTITDNSAALPISLVEADKQIDYGVLKALVDTSMWTQSGIITSLGEPASDIYTIRTLSFIDDSVIKIVEHDSTRFMRLYAWDSNNNYIGAYNFTEGIFVKSYNLNLLTQEIDFAMFRKLYPTYKFKVTVQYGESASYTTELAPTDATYEMFYFKQLDALGSLINNTVTAFLTNEGQIKYDLSTYKLDIGASSIVVYANGARRGFNHSAIMSQIPSAVEDVSGNLTMTINPEYALVYDTPSKTLKIVSFVNVTNKMRVLFTAYYANGNTGLLVETSTSLQIRNISAERLLNSSPSYDDNGIVSNITRYQELFSDVGNNFESFVFFSDPHCFDGDYEEKMRKMISTVEKYYNSTSTDYVLCGGDWLGNSDTLATASYKLGLVKGFGKSMLGGDNFYNIVGNHDYNYQGTPTFTYEQIGNYWYSGDKCYYTIKRKNCNYYALDTGVDNDDTITAYRMAQLKWLCQQLLEDDAPHSTIFMHIAFYYPNSTPTISGMGEKVGAIIEAYNGRSSITLDGSAYNFASCYGKIDMVLCGHVHADVEITLGNVPCVSVINTGKSNSDGASFDLVLVDYDNEVMHMVRVGSGNDRDISLA